MQFCPCGSKKEYDVCCKPYLTLKKNPPTAELLMRARYTAYTMCEVDFIMDTHDPATILEVNKEDVLTWSRSSEWKRLEIIKIKSGKVRDNKGIVEFKAYYESNGISQVHHEKSQFIKVNGKWYYHGWSK